MRQLSLVVRGLLLGLALILVTGTVRLAAGFPELSSVNEPATAPDQSAAEPFDLFLPVVSKPLPAVTSDIPYYGVNFISSVEDIADEQQYQNGLLTGAPWNRWPIYWYSVEKSEGQFDWSAHDTLVIADLAHGLKVNAILMGTPGFYVNGLTQSAIAEPPQRYRNYLMSAPNASTPQGLSEGVFSDGSDIPGPGKQINPKNKWAIFVAAAVNRYMPGGVLAQQYSWPEGVGITYWEMWNEQDYSFFWNATVADYARLLKVGYLAAKQIDADSQILFGGLANFQQPNYLNDVMNVLDGDPEAAEFGYFFDVLATHSYSRSWDSWYHVWRAKKEMKEHGEDKPVWLNESGVPAWDDYPGPVWDPTSSWRSTTTEQADYTIQSAFYAVWAGAEAVFSFQLYDGCGNQAAGSDFPPHNGELCGSDGKLTVYPFLDCAGDAYGFFSNPTDAACFRQHPDPESPRPKLAAIQILTTYFQDVIPLDRKRVGDPDPIAAPQEWFIFYRPETNQRIMGLWARFGEPQVAEVPAVSRDESALLVAADGTVQTIHAVNGSYRISLPGATNLNSDWNISTGYPIGGRPYLLVESFDN